MLITCCAYSCTQYSLHTQYMLLIHADDLLCLQLHLQCLSFYALVRLAFDSALCDSYTNTTSVWRIPAVQRRVQKRCHWRSVSSNCRMTQHQVDCTFRQHPQQSNPYTFIILRAPRVTFHKHNPETHFTHKCSQLQPVPAALVITNITACMTDWSPHAVNVCASQHGKDTAVLIHIVKARRGSWGIAPIILYLGASGRWVIRCTLRPL